MGLKFKISLRNDFDSENRVIKKQKMVNRDFVSEEIVVKKQVMDRTVNRHCSLILKELMNSSGGWLFHHPVDPVVLGIPDYFTIIKNPMDLGTIKRKLDDNRYLGFQEFAADIRLTFENAMLYNPVGNEVHNVAKLLYGNFNAKWKHLEAKLKKDGSESKMSVEKSAQATNQRTMSFEEKLQLKGEIMELLRGGEVGVDLRKVFQKFKVTCDRPEKLQSYIEATGDEVLRKLRGEIKDVVAKAGKVGKVVPARISQTVKSLPKGTQMKASSNLRKPTEAAAPKCSVCSKRICRCQTKKATVQASLSDVSSKHGLFGESKPDSEVNYTSMSHTNRLGPDCDGPGIVLNEERSSDHFTPPPTTSSGEDYHTFNVPMSPRALRAAQLKSRFAATIYKATHQDEKSCHLSMQLKERERLEKEQLRERIRIENEIKAAEEAIRTKAQAELKMKRERERKAARMALEKLERSVEINANQDFLRELEKLCHSPESVVLNPSSLERFGLYRKCDYMEEDDDSALNIEEGEILS